MSAAWRRQDLDRCRRLAERQARRDAGFCPHCGQPLPEHRQIARAEGGGGGRLRIPAHRPGGDTRNESPDVPPASDAALAARSANLAKARLVLVESRASPLENPPALSLCTRDGGPSVGRLLEEAALGPINVAEVSASVAIAWAKRNRVDLAAPGKVARIDARRVELGLPPFRIFRNETAGDGMPPAAGRSGPNRPSSGSLSSTLTQGT